MTSSTFPSTTAACSVSSRSMASGLPAGARLSTSQSTASGETPNGVSTWCSLAIGGGSAASSNTCASRDSIPSIAEKRRGINVNHVHIKTKDPIVTAKYYVDTFGARIKQEVHGRSLQVDLHGLELI